MLRPVMPRYALSGGARSVWIVGASREGSGAEAVVVGADVDAVEVRSEGVRRRKCMYVHVRWRSVEACRVCVCAAVRLRLRSCVLVLVLVAVVDVDVDVTFAGALEAPMFAGAVAGNVDAVAMLWCGVLVLGSSVACRELVLSTRREVLVGHGGSRFIESLLDKFLIASIWR
jgi:hypothetical protein